MIEYRVMYNCYDGKGDIVYMVTDNLVTAIEVSYNINVNKINNHGRAWIQARKVTEWKNIKIK